MCSVSVSGLDQRSDSPISRFLSRLCPSSCRNRLMDVWCTHGNPCHYWMRALRSTAGFVSAWPMQSQLHSSWVCFFLFFFWRGNEDLICRGAVLWCCDRSAVCYVVSLVLRPAYWKVMGFISRRAFLGRMSNCAASVFSFTSLTEFSHRRIFDE